MYVEIYFNYQFLIAKLKNLNFNCDRFSLLDGNPYGNEFEYDLTKLPAWQEAEPEIRHIIINGVKKYLLEQTSIQSDWIGTNAFNRSG